MAGGHEAKILAVGLFRVGKTELTGEIPHLRLGHHPEWKAEPNELGAGRSEKEIALVAVGVGGAVKRPPPSSVVAADDIVACRESVGAEVFRGRE